MHQKPSRPIPTHVHLRWSTETGTVVTTFEFAEYCEAAGTKVPALLGPASLAVKKPGFLRALVASVLIAAAFDLLAAADGLDALNRGVDHP